MAKLCVQLVPLFQGLSFNDQQQLEKLVHRCHVKRGELIVTPDKGQRLVIVEHGKIQLYHLDSDGKQQVQRVIADGSYVGETWLLGANSPSSFVEATEDSTICILDQKDFAELLLNQPIIALNLLQDQASEIATLRWQTQLMSLPSIEDRLLAYLQRQMQLQGSSKILLPVKIKDLASYLGTTPETISRKLVQLEKSGKIKRQLRKIELL